MATKSQKLSQARYDLKRPAGVLVRFLDWELDRLDSERKDGESRPAVIRRLLGRVLDKVT